MDLTTIFITLYIISILLNYIYARKMFKKHDPEHAYSWNIIIGTMFASFVPFSFIITYTVFTDIKPPKWL